MTSAEPDVPVFALESRVYVSGRDEQLVPYKIQDDKLVAIQ